MKTFRLKDVVAYSQIQDIVLAEIRKGSVFLYPTDTVYGLGCNAEDPDAVARIRRIKQSSRPFSVIASKAWIMQNLYTYPEYLEKLPGPYTFIFRKRGGLLEDCSPADTLGVRVPAHPLTEILLRPGHPFVSTSANLSGQKTITRISEFPQHLIEMVDVAIDGGILSGKPSSVIDVSKGKPVILRK